MQDSNWRNYSAWLQNTAKNDIMTNYSYNSEATSPQEHLTSNFHLLALDNSAGWKKSQSLSF